MSEAELRELRGVCEALRSALRSSMRISRFRLDLVCPGARQRSVLLVERRAGSAPLGRAALRRAAVMTAPVRDAAGVVASVTIEDDSRAFLPAAARDHIERVAAIYAPMLRASLHAGGSWPRQNVVRRTDAISDRGRLSHRALLPPPGRGRWPGPDAVGDTGDEPVRQRTEHRRERGARHG